MMQPLDGISLKIIYRTYPCTFEGGQGTFFQVDREGKRYIVTAYHVVKGIETTGLLGVYGIDGSGVMAVNVIGIDAQFDIAVLTPTMTGLGWDTRSTRVNYGMDGIVMGQPVYCAGYPPSNGLTPLAKPDTNSPMPVITCGPFSALGSDEGNPLFHVGVHAAAGMSGGPIAFQNRDTLKWSVGGITIGAIPEERKHNDEKFIWPSGFTVGVKMSVAEALIDKNPQGIVIAT